MPRRADLGEHRNDHQRDTAAEMSRLSNVTVVEDSASHNADQTTLQTVTRWRFRPASSGGTPVESLYVGRLTCVRDP